MFAFITGSHAYGEPNEDSDVDLVIYVRNSHDAALLLQKYGTRYIDRNSGHPYHDLPLRCGDLNLILCIHEKEWGAWYTGTEMLKRRHQATHTPIRKKRAKSFLDKIRQRLGIHDRGDSGINPNHDDLTPPTKES